MLKLITIMALSDPFPMFEGRELMNTEGYLCYLNAISNGLLSLKSFRQLIQFMNPMMRDFFYHILIGEMKHLESLRKELHKFNPNFFRGIHSDACEALNQMIKLMDLDDLFKISLVEIKRTQRCTVCAEQSIFSVDASYGSPNILMLQRSTEISVQEEVDNYIRNIKKVPSNEGYCNKCQAFVTMTLSDSLKTNKILMIRICRFSDNFNKINKEVNVNHILQVGTSRYKAKCFISHHGQSAKSGHYTTTILKNNNEVLKYDDTIRSEQTRCSKDPYIIWYERIDSEEANIGEDESENPVEQNVELNKNKEVNMEEEDDEDDVNPDDEINDIEESGVREKNDESSNLLEMKADETGKVECKYCLNSYVNILIHLKKKTNCMKNYVKNNEYDTLEKDIICNICERKFTRKHNLLQHQKKQHNTVENEKVKCNKCGKQYANESILKTHNYTVHEKNKDFICNICEKKFTVQHSLLEHQKKQHNIVEKNCQKKSKLRRKRKHNSNTEKLSSDADSSKSPSKWFVIEKETFTCKICQKPHDNIEKLIKHINKVKCQYTNVKELKKLQTQYLKINEVELISCPSCSKLFAINNITQHFEKKKDCQKEYSDRNEKKINKKELNEHKKKTKRKTNAETNPKRITKIMKRKRNYESINSGEETFERVAKNSKYDQCEYISCKVCRKSFDDIKKMINHLNRFECRSNYNNVDLEDLKNKFQKLKGLELIICLCCRKLIQINGILHHLNKSTKNNCKEEYKNQNKLEPLLEKIQQRKKKINLSHIKAFNQRQETGRDYVCVCCCTIRFRKSVQELTKELILDFKDPKLNVYQHLSLYEKYKFDGKFWIHHNCLIVLKKGKMPQICAKNGLDHCKIPQVFKDATPMEILAIKKTIPFTFIRQLPRSRMPYMKKSRIINVPISDNDVLKTVLSLPRVNDQLATVNLAFKARQRDTNYYKPPEIVRPKVINEMLKILQKNHKSYKNFPIELLSESSKYKFITLPLVGENEPDENTPTLAQAIEKLQPPILLTLKLRRGDTNIPIDAHSFINALKDHMR